MGEGGEGKVWPCFTQNDHSLHFKGQQIGMYDVVSTCFFCGTVFGLLPGSLTSSVVCLSAFLHVILT